MRATICLAFCSIAAFAPAGSSAAVVHFGGHGGPFYGGHHHGHCNVGLGGGFGWGWGLPYFVPIGAYGVPLTFSPIVPPLLPAANGPLPLPARVPAPFAGPLAGPLPVRRAPARVAEPVAKKSDTEKGSKLVTYGDRLFRAGNTHKAQERYEQAARAAPSAAAPHVRLAQIAILKGQYSQAAEQIRVALAAEPRWLVNAPDIQSIYAEPGDFARQISRLESHLLVEPTDRDGWLVLGAELYLSGQTRRAADVFLRLTDRKPDAALTAFLDATNAGDAKR
jgi:hypothetical protein